MKPTEPSLQYKGGAWGNAKPGWVRVHCRHANPAHYSSVGLSFRTRIAGRQPRV